MIKRDTTLDIIGDGECRRELEMLIADKKLMNVRLHGRITRDEVKKFYAKRSALILPSVYEVQPIVLLEAMASGIPVIVTKGIGIEVGPQEAVLIEPTVQGILDGIESFATMAPDAQELLADAARKRAEKHRWDTLISSYVQLYDRVARDI
jgi:glycosyltransferase involved in cell wall biosynthesis